METSSANHLPFVDLAGLHAPLAAELHAAFGRVLDASSFILGQEVESFETAFSDYCGTRHCIGVASGTSALTIMLAAAGIGPGSEVIVPAHTFVASGLAVVHAGATPVCVDVERSTGLIDPAAVEAAVGPATAAILAVHLYGQACSMEALQELARRHGLLLFEDAAQAHGATYRGKRTGGLGHAAAFSFYPSKNLGALGDGGAICTDDEELAVRARRLRDLGRDESGAHVATGYNERLDGLQAALLRVKLPHLDGWNSARRERARSYQESLDESVELLEEAPETPCTYHLFPIRVGDRGGLRSRLSSVGIQTGIHYDAVLPDQPALRGTRAAEHPVSRDWAARTLSLPIFPHLADADLRTVASTVAQWQRQQVRTGVGV